MSAGDLSAESRKKLKNWRSISAVIFFILLVLTLILTATSLLSYASAKTDYGMVCLPANTPPLTYPRCISDLNQMTDSESWSVFGAALEAFCLFLSRRIQPVFYFFSIFSVFLFAYIIIFLIW
jgi:hypothetical protein